jgi:hypothetical protein
MVSPETLEEETLLEPRGTTCYEIVLRGERTDEDAVVTAQCCGSIALLGVRVRSKMPSPPPGHSGMFREPEFSLEVDPHQPSSYSAELGQVVIYVRFPSVEMYLGPSCEHRGTLSAQVRIADLIADKCFQEIARRQVDVNGAVVRLEGVSDYVQQKAYMLAQKYGKRLHEALVDQSLLRAERLMVEQVGEAKNGSLHAVGSSAAVQEEPTEKG